MLVAVDQSVSSEVSMPSFVSLGKIRRLGKIDNDFEAHPFSTFPTSLLAGL